MAYPRYLKSRDFKFSKRTSGNFTTAAVGASTFTVVDATMDLVLFAQTGDTIEVGVDCITLRPTADIFLDVGTINGVSLVTRFGGGNSGIPGLYSPSATNVLDGTYLYTLIAADVASLTITLRLLYATSAASQTIQATTASPLLFWAKNLGPPDPH